MTENEAEILSKLRTQRERVKGDESLSDWLIPLRFGGGSGSHHPVTVKRMVPKGWVEKRQREGGSAQDRPSFEYRITPAGVKALSNHLATKALA